VRLVNKVKDGTGAYGFNAATGAYEDLIAAGVIDPAKVSRTALQNASSVAGLMLTTEAMVADRPKEEEKGAPAGGGRGGTWSCRIPIPWKPGPAPDLNCIMRAVRPRIGKWSGSAPWWMPPGETSEAVFLAAKLTDLLGELATRQDFGGLS
jgi:hypothetical protein